MTEFYFAASITVIAKNEEEAWEKICKLKAKKVFVEDLNLL